MTVTQTDSVRSVTGVGESVNLESLTRKLLEGRELSEAAKGMGGSPSQHEPGEDVA